MWLADMLLWLQKICYCDQHVNELLTNPDSVCMSRPLRVARNVTIGRLRMWRWAAWTTWCCCPRSTRTPSQTTWRRDTWTTTSLYPYTVQILHYKYITTQYKYSVVQVVFLVLNLVLPVRHTSVQFWSLWIHLNSFHTLLTERWSSTKERWDTHTHTHTHIDLNW